MTDVRSKRQRAIRLRQTAALGYYDGDICGSLIAFAEQLEAEAAALEREAPDDPRGYNQ